jgi:hypothetical protein
MNFTEYKMTRTRVLHKSAMIWIVAVLLVIISVVLTSQCKQVADMILLNAMLSLLLLPGIIIHLNYRRKSSNRKIILNGETVVMTFKDGRSAELVNTEISRIEWHKTKNGNNRIPWIRYEYFVLSDGKKHLLVPCYIMTLSELKNNKLSSGINFGNIISKESFYQYID